MPSVNNSDRCSVIIRPSLVLLFTAKIHLCLSAYFSDLVPASTSYLLRLLGKLTRHSASIHRLGQALVWYRAPVSSASARVGSLWENSPPRPDPDKREHFTLKQRRLPTTNIEWETHLSTWTGLAAMRSPATPPPMTRPSGPAKETLIPPDLLLVPPTSLGMNEPDRDSISKRPCNQPSTLIRC